MKTPDIPANEPVRIRALQELKILYTPAEERFDRITRLAGRLFNVPIALVSLVADDKQWFKSRQGLAAPETGRDISFCGHAILNEDVFVVPNALKDPDFRDNPLVTGPPNIRFYAGQPIHFAKQRIGTLCIIDDKPRQLRPAEYDSLKSLAKWVELELKEWSAAKESFISRVMNLAHDEALLDPVTGNLNAKGVELIRQNLVAQPDAHQLVIQLQHLDALGDTDKANALKIKVADCLRTTLEESGIVGFIDPDKFLLLLSGESNPSVDRTEAKVKQALANLHAAEPIPTEINITTNKVVPRAPAQ